LASENGVGFFNILAFRGVFFGSPFTHSDHFRWFDSLADWKQFYAMEKGEANKYEDERYYVTKNCYGQSQIGRQLSLLPSYWDQRTLWNDMFNKPAKPTVCKVFKWLIARQTVDVYKKQSVTVFSNIGELTALLICGDLVEAGIIPMPSAEEWAKLIAKVGKGSKAGLEMCGFIEGNNNQQRICEAFVSLDLALQQELSNKEKEAIGYNVIMLEHALCKIKRLTNRKISEAVIYSEISR